MTCLAFAIRLYTGEGSISAIKEGLWVNYSLTDGGRSPYAASLLGNLMHWLEDDPEIRALIGRIDDVRREDLCLTSE